MSNALETKFSADSDYANAARGDTGSSKEFLDCIEFRGMGGISMGGLQLRGYGRALCARWAGGLEVGTPSASLDCAAARSGPEVGLVCLCSLLL